MTDPFGPGSDSPTPARTTAVADIRTSVFHSNIPTYILTEQFWFDDWNSAFELIFGDVPGVQRRSHVSVWSQSLSNHAAVRAHGERFRTTPPSVDTEPIEFESTRFGKFLFKKIATSAIAEGGATVGWVVVLNIDSVEKADAYYAELSDRMAAQLAWTKYAVCYDRVLQEFGPYRDLARAHVDAVSAGQRILDLGAGTGFITRQLLARRKSVQAIDYNDAMLQRLHTYCGGFPELLTVTKADLETLQGLPDNAYDGAVMMNTLSWLASPLSCLRKAWSALRHGGVLALSCPSETSTLEALFGAIESDLLKRRRLDRLREDLDRVRERNEEMERRGWLRKFTLEGVQQLLTNAGFTKFPTAESGVYAGQGLFVVAQK